MTASSSGDLNVCLSVCLSARLKLLIQLNRMIEYAWPDGPMENGNFGAHPYKGWFVAKRLAFALSRKWKLSKNGISNSIKVIFYTARGIYRGKSFSLAHLLERL